MLFSSLNPSLLLPVVLVSFLDPNRSRVALFALMLVICIYGDHLNGVQNANLTPSRSLSRSRQCFFTSLCQDISLGLELLSLFILLVRLRCPSYPKGLSGNPQICKSSSMVSSNTSFILGLSIYSDVKVATPLPLAIMH